MVVVAISVGLHLMAPAADFADQLGVPGHLFTETEERRAEGELIEAVEHIGRRAGVRTVVEGQRYRVAAGSPPPAEIAGQDTEGRPLPQAHHAGNHVGAGRRQADRNQDPSRPPVP